MGIMINKGKDGHKLSDMLENIGIEGQAVSYTHLTLPTIYSV